MYSFTKQKKQNAVHSLIRRLIDGSNANLLPCDDDARRHNRVNRTIPVLLLPDENGEPNDAEAAFAVTKNISSDGASFVLHQPFRPEGLFVGIPMDSETKFFSASLRQCVPIGGGFWQVGVEFLEVVNPAAWERQIPLEALVARLVPRSNSKNLPTADTLR